MSLWITLFSSLLIIFGAGVFIWHRTMESKKTQRFAKKLVAGFDADTPTITTTVLIPTSPAHKNGQGQAGPPSFDGDHRTQARKTLALMAGCAIAGFLIGTRFENVIGIAAPFISAVAFAMIPRTLDARKTRKRLNTLEEQFPEALDFLARSVRAGNAFSIGLELLAAETSEPLKTEIMRMTREMALGARLDDALQGLIVRVPLLEIRFFASAVLLQRETGGNLSEVLGKLAVSLRERLRLRGHIKAASGQGRLTAGVLTTLPIATVAMLKFMSPDYLNGLTGDPLGRNLLAAAAVSQFLGYLVMKKIINIEV